MIIHARDGIRGQLIDLVSRRPIPKAVWFDTDTGEYEALQVDDNGTIIYGEDGKALRIRAKTRLHFIPGQNISKRTDTTEEEKRDIREVARRLPVPILTKKCHHYACDKLANWSVSDEVDLPPVVVNGKAYSQAKVIAIRFYCAKHYKPPRLLDHKGEVVKIFEDAGGVRPQWHS